MAKELLNREKVNLELLGVISYIEHKAIELRINGTMVTIGNYVNDTEKNKEKKYWKTVFFIVETQAQIQAIYNLREKLSEIGITFDSGGSDGEIEWSLDWSLKF